MDDALHRQLYSLVHGRRIASLGTLDKGEPFVSMVPYALHGERASPIIHVSALSAHTRHMLVHPRVSFMVTESENAPDGDGQPIAPQALPRVTVQGDASRLDPEGDDYTAAKRAYLARFPDAALMFELGDFSLFVIQPVNVRFIAGFGKAHSLRPDDWARLALPA